MRSENKLIRKLRSLNISSPCKRKIAITLLIIILVPTLTRNITGENITVKIRKQTPSFTEMISKDYLSSEEPVISPDGNRIIYFVRETDWAKNCFREYCYLYKKFPGGLITPL